MWTKNVFKNLEISNCKNCKNWTRIETSSEACGSYQYYACLPTFALYSPQHLNTIVAVVAVIYTIFVKPLWLFKKAQSHFNDWIVYFIRFFANFFKAWLCKTPAYNCSAYFYPHDIFTLLFAFFITMSISTVCLQGELHKRKNYNITFHYCSFQKSGNYKLNNFFLNVLVTSEVWPIPELLSFVHSNVLISSKLNNISS